MPRLLVVHHTPSPSLHAMYGAVMEGAGNDLIEGVEVVSRAALGATAVDVLGADGYVLGTPANLGSMSGALKHFFDTVYYPCLEETQKRPFGVYVHGNNDVDGAVTAIARITTGLGWRQAQEAVRVIGEPDRADLDACWDVGGRRPRRGLTYARVMSIPVDVSELADRVSEYGPTAFLVTVGAGGAPHAVSVAATLEDERLVCGAGRTTAANAGERPDVTLLWPGSGDREYCLLVDGTAEVDATGERVLIAPVRAVLHRLQDAPGEGPSCVTVLDRRDA